LKLGISAQRQPEEVHMLDQTGSTDDRRGSRLRGVWAAAGGSAFAGYVAFLLAWLAHAAVAWPGDATALFLVGIFSLGGLAFLPVAFAAALVLIWCALLLPPVRELLSGGAPPSTRLALACGAAGGAFAFAVLWAIAESLGGYWISRTAAPQFLVSCLAGGSCAALVLRRAALTHRAS
jgi:hypothetical protein